MISNYLQKQKPDFPQINDIPELNGKKWLSMVASGNDRVFKDTGSFDSWPHARGDLDLNPLYQKIGMDDKHTERYKFSYPSEWYKFEDFQWLTYAPAEVSIATDIKNRLKNNKKSAEVNKLIDNFVVLGFPQKYM